MAKEIVFVRDKESHLPDNGSHLFGRMQYPFSERHKQYLAEIKDWRGCDKEKVWYSYLDDSSSKIKYRLKPLSNWMMNFVETIEGHPLLRKFDGIRQLSWEFAYYIYTSESEEAFRFSAPTWFIKIRDESGNIVHKNWTLAMDQYADIRLKYGTATNDDPIDRGRSYWFRDNTVGRLVDAIYSHMRLYEFQASKVNK